MHQVQVGTAHDAVPGPGQSSSGTSCRERLRWKAFLETELLAQHSAGHWCCEWCFAITLSLIDFNHPTATFSRLISVVENVIFLSLVSCFSCTLIFSHETILTENAGQRGCLVWNEVSADERLLSMSL